MKWSDLTLKERKQIYDAVRAENPNASYFDIKSQFDLIPEYEDGGKKIMPPKELGLTPGTPEYYKRQQQISGRAELVQPEAYVTPVGYIKDAITTAEELEKGNYGNAAVSTLMNVIPWGIGKGLRKIKSRVSNTLNTPIEIHSSMVDEYPSILAEKARRKTSEDFLFDPRNTGVVNNANKLQYNMYRNKSRFVDRINNLTLMEFITPLLLPVAGYETNKE
ncbi:hypothetical protein [uncultured phage cr1_1]|uniref:Uncharacterized protein n=1 Tax=uncultured phage cr1_1 TaxID=2772064 RepID=A0A7M1RVM1_9CAUD|nr:hypothetical protein KNV31_gp016 [uncultured phage cr1_1]QOR58467.1 hypothetical protein [uncultured phage cr1_1]